MSSNVADRCKSTSGGASQICGGCALVLAEFIALRFRKRLESMSRYGGNAVGGLIRIGRGRAALARAKRAEASDEFRRLLCAAARSQATPSASRISLLAHMRRGSRPLVWGHPDTCGRG